MQFKSCIQKCVGSQDKIIELCPLNFKIQRKKLRFANNCFALIFSIYVSILLCVNLFVVFCIDHISCKILIMLAKDVVYHRFCSTPGRVIPKTIRLVFAAYPLSTQLLVGSESE